jgi:hypothetical protein
VHLRISLVQKFHKTPIFTKFKGQAKKGICKLSYMGNGAITDGCCTLQKQCINKLINQFTTDLVKGSKLESLPLL